MKDRHPAKDLGHCDADLSNKYYVAQLRLQSSITVAVLSSVYTFHTSVRPFVHSFVHPCFGLCMSVCVRPFVHSFVHPCFGLCMSVCVRPFVHSFVHPCLACVCLSVSVHQSVRPFIRPSLFWPVYVCLCPSISPSVRSFVCSYISRLYVCPSDGMYICSSVRLYVWLADLLSWSSAHSSALPSARPYVYPFSRQARSQDFVGKGARFWVTASKGVRGVTPEFFFEKRTCDLVHYIASVA